MKYTRNKSNNPINLTKIFKKTSSGINRKKSCQYKQEIQHKKGEHKTHLDTSR